MSPSDFLAKLWGNPPPGRVLVWTLPDKKSRWYSSFDAVDADVLCHEHRDVYTGVSLAPKTGVRLTAHNRLREHQVAGIPAFWADIDVSHPVHKRESQLPPTPELALEALAALPFEPTIIIDSGHGLQLWWLLEEPWLFDTPEERELARRASQWWHSLIKDPFQHKGWIVDSTFDLSRVMRLPGTWNNKIPDDRRRVEVTGGNGERYPLPRFLDLVPETFTADRGRPRQKRSGDNGRGGSSSAIISLIADPEPAPASWLLETLLDMDPRFRQTWEQRRPDLPDQSPSGYDMALAHAAVRAGWPDEEVRHLLIAFRRKHQHALKLREDYFALTISKARASLERPGDTAGPRDNVRAVEQPGDSRKEGAGVQSDALPSSMGDDATGGSDTEIGKGGEGLSDVVHLLETVRRLVMQDPPAADCRDPGVLRLVTEIRAALTGPAASPEATSAAAQLLTGYSAYASSGKIEDLEALAAAAAAAMGPEVQAHLLVRDAAEALAKGQKSVDFLMALAAMLRRQTTSVRNRAKTATLAEAASLPLPRSILKAKGKNGSLLDAGEVAVLSGMGGAGKKHFHRRSGLGDYGPRSGGTRGGLRRLRRGGRHRPTGGIRGQTGGGGPPRQAFCGVHGQGQRKKAVSFGDASGGDHGDAKPVVRPGPLHTSLQRQTQHIGGMAGSAETRRLRAAFTGRHRPGALRLCGRRQQQRRRLRVPHVPKGPGRGVLLRRHAGDSWHKILSWRRRPQD